jgi:tetratricopeptide (TPR) repeat protein/tRNA A-37 threonylcarbamoyl transferase component Bud32
LNESQIFTNALKLATAGERAAYLDEACAGNPGLRADVEALLRAYAADPGFLEQPAPSVHGTVDMPGAFGPPRERPPAPAVTEQPGVVLAGRYKLLQQIGEGGMGAVWMAEQTEPVQRKVALKIIKAGMDSRQVLARFEAERQALALMDHPNIAKVHDGGATDSVRPYFVMELVKGQPITTYCDEQRLTVRQRLELFLPVCQAIQHAHQKGIIHRDIKPSNVLIAPYDGKPVVKMIDFGIAKATGQQLTEKTLFTDFGAVVGTLEYMSPEQAELNNQDIDTRSDIYSLGVLLYELLTGTTPLERKRLKEGALLEVLQRIREEEPPTPSTRLSTTDELPAIAANRGLEPRKLSGLVRGELDWIVMKALEKDRGRRYETANSFALDVQRYLADEPVLACPPSAWYRFRKYARRHRAALGTAVVLAAALLVAVVVLVLSNVRVRRESAEKTAALEQSQRDLNGALQVVEQMLTRTGAERLAGLPHMEEVRRDLLEDALKFYQRFLEENRTNPKVRFETARACRRAGDIQHLLGRDHRAGAAYDQGIALLQALSAERPDLADYRRELALCHYGRGQMLGVAGSPRDAEQAFDQALKLYEELVAENPEHGIDRDNLTTSRYGLALVYESTGRLDEAEKALHRILREAEALVARFPAEPAHRKSLAVYCLKLANLLMTHTDQVQESERLFRKAVALAEQVARKPPHEREYEMQVAANHAGLANALMHTGRFEEAGAEYRKAQALLKKLTDDFPSRPDYRLAYAQSHGMLGNFHQVQHQLEQAEKAWEQDRKLQERLAAEYPTSAKYQSSYGASLSNRSVGPAERGELREARSLLEEAIRRQQAALKINPKEPTYRLYLSTHCTNLALLLGELKTAEQEKVLQQAIAAAKQLAADFPSTADYQRGAAAVLHNASRIRRRQGKLKEALRQVDEALPYLQAALKSNPNNPLSLRALCDNHSNRYWACTGLGKAVETETALRQWIDVLERLRGQRPKDASHRSESGGALTALGGLLLRRPGRQAEGRRLLKQAVADLTEAIKLAPGGAKDWINRGTAYYDLGQMEKARDNFSEAIRLKPKDATAWYNRGNAYTQLGQDKLAVADYSQAIVLNEELASAWGSRGETYRRLRQRENALADLDRAIKLNRKDARSWSNRGTVHYELGHSAEAAADFTEAIRLNPENAVAWSNRGNVRRKLRQLAGAVADCTEAIKRDKNYAPAWSNRANAHVDLGQHKQAIDDYSQAIELDAGFGQAWCYRGTVYLQLGRLAEALHDLTRALEIDENDRIALANRGVIYLRQGPLTKAITDFSKLLEIEPKNVSAWTNRGAVYFKLARWKRAIADFDQAIALGTRDANAWFYRGTAHLRSGDPRSALPDLDEAIKRVPNDATYRNSRALAHVNMGQLEKALKDLDKAVKLAPTVRPIRLNRLRMLLRLGQFEKTIADCSELIAQAPKDEQLVEVYLLRAQANSQLSRFREALADNEKAVELAPKQAAGYGDLAWLLATCPDPRVRDPGRAVEMATKATKLHPSGQHWNTLGVAHYRAGNWQAAVDALKQSTRLRQGGDAFDWLFLAMAHRKLGRHDEAGQAYDRAVQWLEKNPQATAKHLPRAETLRHLRSEAEEVLELKKK